jgi:hypothetical protein
MSQQALISGRLQGAPTTRPTRTGGEWTAFKLKVASGNRVEFWNVSTFSDTARSEIAGLGEGDALSAVGELSVETHQWNPRAQAQACEAQGQASQIIARRWTGGRGCILGCANPRSGRRPWRRRHPVLKSLQS